MRLFVAIEADDKLKEVFVCIQEWIKGDEAKTKFVEKENFHTTIKFLGEANEEKCKEIIEVIKEVGAEFKQFDLILKNVGVHKHGGRIDNFWVGGAGEGEEKYKKMQELLDKKLEVIGFKREGRGYKSHFTLGRVKFVNNKEGLMKKINKFRDMEIGVLHINKIKLKQSKITPEGPIYTDVFVYELSK